jgi:hypothetical protein
MNKKLILILIAVLCFQDYTLAQTYTNEQLQTHYWNYRDRFRKYFIHIGLEDGKSIPFEGLDPDFKVTPLNYDVNNTSLYPKVKGLINYGDANITHGWYLAVLATEYRLLKDAGNDADALTACRNEIYLALEAINRIDLNSKKYFVENPGSTLTTDGFLTRGDVNEDFYKNAELDNAGFSQNFQWVHSDLFKGVDITSYNNSTNIVTTANGSQFNAGKAINQIAHRLVGFGENINGGYGHYGAEMSQDHYYGLLFGLYFIHKFVDNDYVKPTINSRGFYLKDEMKIIAKRLTDHFAKVKDAPIFGETNDIGKNVTAILGAPWAMTNPDKENKLVARGGMTYTSGFSAGVSVIVNEILGENRYSKASGTYRKKHKGSEDQERRFIENQNTLFGEAMQFLINTQNARKITQNAQGKAYDGKNIFNFNMLFKLSTMSKKYSISQVEYASSLFYQNKDWMWVLIYKMLDGQTSADIEQPSTFLKNFNQLGCEIYNTETKSFRDDDLVYKWLFENKINMYSGSDGAEETELKKGEFNGLDFMLIHNLYRLYYKEKINVSFKDNACKCSDRISDLDYYNTIPSSLSTNLDINAMNLSYKSYNIPAPAWLTHNLSINAGGILNVKRDLNICNSTLSIETAGKLTTNIGADVNHLNVIKVRKGSIIEIKQGGTLYIENNSKLLLEPGATLIIHPGAQIILNGPNAVIHINGKMILKPNADFNPIAGTNGYGKVVFENNAGELYVKCEGNNKMIINPGTKGTHINLEAKGAYGMHTGWQPGLRLF